MSNKQKNKNVIELLDDNIFEDVIPNESVNTSINTDISDITVNDEVPKAKKIKQKKEKSSPINTYQEGAFTLKNIQYKQKKAECVEGYVAKQDEILIYNRLQPVSTDIARISNVHLLTMLCLACNVPADLFQQAKTTTGWAFVYKPGFDTKMITESEIYPTLKHMGFAYNESLKNATYYAANADIQSLASQDVETLQAAYNVIVDAAIESDRLNSKNNMFAVSVHQKSAWLLELNKVMKAVAQA